jgi:formate dehydrogenase maturation protein FdhE
VPTPRVRARGPSEIPKSRAHRVHDVASLGTSPPVEIDEVTRARTVIQWIDQTISELKTRRDPTWDEQVRALRALRQETIRAVREKYPGTHFSRPRT